MINTVNVIRIFVFWLSLINVSTASSKQDYIVAIWKEQKMDWNSAEIYCQNTYESHLGTMLTMEDYNLAYNYSYFSGMNGLNDKNKDGVWTWIDGTPCDYNSPKCTVFFEENDQLDAYCGIIPWGGHKVNEVECDKENTQFYCTKVRSYIYVSAAKSYNDAEAFCQTQYGTHLGTITRDRDINNALNKIVEPHVNVWTGLYKYNDQNAWIDGTEYIAEDVSDIVNLQENGSKCRSFEYNNNIIADNDQCNELLPFLCNKIAKPREYIISTDDEKDKTFNEARHICKEKYNSDLATVITEQEFSDVLHLLYYFEVGWIGLRKIDDKYQWVDGTECTETDNNLCISYWNEYDPNEPAYDCGMVFQNGRAKSRQCNETATYFLCNKPIQSYQIDEQKEEL